MLSFEMRVCNYLIVRFDSFVWYILLVYFLWYVCGLRVSTEVLQYGFYYLVW